MHQIQHPFPATPCPHCAAKDAETADSLRMHELLAAISSRFVLCPPDQVDEAIDATQHLVCDTLGLDRSTLWQTSGDGNAMAMTHQWSRPGLPPPPRNFDANSNLPWVSGILRSGRSFHFTSLCDFPPEAAHDVETLQKFDAKSNAVFPFIVEGRFFGALCFGKITAEREWMEKELAGLQLVAQMIGHVISRHRAEERVEQLQGEIQRAAKSAVLGELAATLAHEINQPLCSIMHNAQAAQRFLAQGSALPGEIHAILEDIVRDNKRASEVISQLRSMLTSTPSAAEPNCLNSLVVTMREILAADLKANEVELEFDPAPALPRIMAARPELHQVLLNLVTNAIQAMRDTPADDRTIVVQTRAGDKRVHLLVRDRGCGIAPNQLNAIFEPFHTTRSDGLGMGLAICRRIVEAHNGVIEARNAAAGGAEFEVILPALCP